MSKDKMDLIWGIEQMEKELAKNHNPASNIMSICTEVLKQVNELIDSFIEQHFIKCEFNDECDTCHNDNREQSYMKGTMEEAEYYICRSCALKYIHAHNSSNR